MNETELKAKGFFKDAKGEWSKPNRVGGLRAEVSKPDQGPALVRRRERTQKSGLGLASGGPKYRVTLTHHCLLRPDSDNATFGYKGLRDEIAAFLGLDDADDVIEWEYGVQLTRGRPGTAVRIERL